MNENKKHMLQEKKALNPLYFLAFIVAIMGIFVFSPTKSYAEGIEESGDFFVVTQPPTRLDDFVTSFSGFVNNKDNEASYVWFEAGRNGVFEKSSNKQREIGKSDFANHIYSFEEGVEYIYRAVARHEKTGEIKYGETKTFVIADYNKTENTNQTNTIKTHTNNQQNNNVVASTGLQNDQNTNNSNTGISETVTIQNDIASNLNTKKSPVFASNTTNLTQQNKTDKKLDITVNWGVALREQFFSTDKKGNILVNNNLKTTEETNNNLATVGVVSGKKIFPESLFGWMITIVLIYLIISRMHNFSVAKKKKKERAKTNKINNIEIEPKNRNGAFIPNP